MAKPPKDDQFTDDETARRRDAVIKHMLNSPPKPHSEMKIGKRKAESSAKASPPKKRGRPSKNSGAT
jgi:hypothetical protein